MRNILFFLLAAFLCIQCKNECVDDSIKLGNLSFDDNTLEFFDFYEGKESLRFYSNFGEIIEHTISSEPSNNPSLCMEVICRPSYEVEGINGCIYYDTEDRHYILRNGDISIDIKSGIELFETGAELNQKLEYFYDYVEIGVTNESSSSYAGLITASNFTDPVNINPSVLTNYLVPMSTSDLTNFQDVWVYQRGEDEFHVVYKKGVGLVAYKIDDVVWTLMQ